jgi:Transposase DDE domain
MTGRATLNKALKAHGDADLPCEAFEQSCRERKRVEMLFAHLKRILRLGRLRLRGPHGAQDEFTLVAIAQNLRRLGKFVARPPPQAMACVA